MARRLNGAIYGRVFLAPQPPSPHGAADVGWLAAASASLARPAGELPSCIPLYDRPCRWCLAALRSLCPTVCCCAWCLRACGLRTRLAVAAVVCAAVPPTKPVKRCFSRNAAKRSGSRNHTRAAEHSREPRNETQSGGFPFPSLGARNSRDAGSVWLGGCSAACCVVV